MHRASKEPIRGAETKLIDDEAVAAMLGCSTRHVARMARTGLMPKALRLGKLRRWSRPAIVEWVDRGCPRVGASR